MEIEVYTNDRGVQCVRGVEESTPMSALGFIELFPEQHGQSQYVLHTNLGSLTIVDRMTGFGWRDVETGYREPDAGKFWLASGQKDVRRSGAETWADAVAWVKSEANTCTGV